MRPPTNLPPEEIWADVDPRGFDADSATFGHSIPRIGNQIGNDLFDVCCVHLHPKPLAFEVQLESDVCPEHLAEP
jgi:hypothetical protein